MENALMKVLYYIFDQSGPYNWQRTEIIEGPYYDEETIIRKNGYETHDEAMEALKKLVGKYQYGPFFVMPGYHPESK